MSIRKDKILAKKVCDGDADSISESSTDVYLRSQEYIMIIRNDHTK